MEKKKYEDVKQLLMDKGVVLTSKEYVNNITKLKMVCFCGEEFEKSLKIMNSSKLYMCNTCVTKQQAEKQKLPYLEAKAKIEQLGYTMLTEENEYQGIRKKCKLMCDKGHVYSQIPADLFSGHICKKCASISNAKKRKLPYSKIKECVESKGFKLLTTKEEYISSDMKLTVECEHGHITNPNYHNIKKGCECRRCYIIKAALRNTIPYEERCEYVESYGFKVITPKEDYINGEHKVKIRCDEGHVYMAKLHDFYMGNRCPHCKKSKGEVGVERVLKEYGIKHETQYTFDDCRYKNLLPFDFYIPSKNTCIEYDGKQHYMIRNSWNTFDNFVDIKIRDTIKNVYCEQNGIKLIRIPYWDYKNIEKILINELLLK